MENDRHRTTPARLLVRGVNWLGDAVMTTPALLRLRERLPNTKISLLVPSKLSPLLDGHPAIDSVIPFASGCGPWGVASRLKPEKFEAALILPNSPRSALEAFLARIPDRAGLARPWRGWFLTRSIPERPDKVFMRKAGESEIRRRIESPENPGSRPNHGPAVHQSNDYLYLAAQAFGCNRAPIAPLLHVSAEETAAALGRLGLQAGNTYVGINPGAEYGPAKRWPAERFIEAARSVQRRAGVHWLIFGVAQDARTCGQIADALNAGKAGTALDLAGRTNLRELMALLKTCRAVLTNDSGPMHVAAALGTPVIVPFGSTSPELTGPLPQGAHTVLRAGAACSPCFLRTCPIDFRCMLRIEPESAADAILRHLAKA